MSKANDLATKKFVKDTVDGAVKDLRGEMKKNQEVVLERLDSIMDSIKKFDEGRNRTCLSSFGAF